MSNFQHDEKKMDEKLKVSLRKVGKEYSVYIHAGNESFHTAYVAELDDALWYGKTLETFFEKQFALGVQQERDLLKELLEEARSDTAPFSTEPIEHANNLIKQKNDKLDEIIKLINKKEDEN